MGYGQNLKKAIEDNKSTVYKVAKGTGIRATTLYSCIQRDSEPSLDNALRISKFLGVKLSDLCDISNVPGVGYLDPEAGAAPGVEYLVKDPDWGLREQIEEKLVPILMGYKTVDLDRFVVPLLMKYLVLDNNGMKIALEVIDALHSTHSDGIREDYLDETMQGAFTPEQTREYYRKQIKKQGKKK